MRKPSVAVLDVRSSEMTAVVGERGVNNTFIIKSKYSCEYDGFAEGEFLDNESFISAVCDVVKSTLNATVGIKTFYVGIPGEFSKLVTVDKVLSFQSAKKISPSDCKALVEMSAPADDSKYLTVRHSCIYYVLSDKRKVINPVGAVSDGLQGKFAFYKCNRTYIDRVMDAFSKFTSIKEVRFIPSDYAEATYLVEPEQRDECAVLFDLGYISSTYSVICGNGLLYSQSFSIGIGHIAVYLMSELEIPYDVATTFLSTVNLNAKERLSTMEECMYGGELYRFSTVTLRDKIREGLDGICEAIEECRQSFGSKNIDGKPLLLTGDGVNIVRGAAEHIAGRLVKVVDITSPKVPYYDKPQFASLFSLLDTALGDAEKK